MKTKISDRTIILTAAVIFTVMVTYAVVGRINDDEITGAATASTTTTLNTGADVTGAPGVPAKVTISEYSDFQCPYCARVVPTVHKIQEEYGGAVEVIFKHFPLEFHSYAKKAAEAAECAKDQGGFWEYHDKLFENQNRLSVNDLKKYAEDIGLDSQAFNNCLDNGIKAQLVENDYAEGLNSGVRGAPTFYINGQQVVGAQPYETFAEIIDVMISVNSEEEVDVGGSTETEAVLEEVKPLVKSDDDGSCGGNCGSPTCAARTRGPCGCS